MTELDPLLQWLLAMNLWTAALLAVAVLLDVALARRLRPSWRIALYATVAVRLALPADWHTPLGALGAAPSEASGDAELVAAEPPTLLGPAPSTSVSAPTRADGLAAAAPPWPRADAVLAFVWFAVALALLSALAVARARLARSLRAVVPPRARVAARIPGVAVYEHDRLGPLTFGALHPRIVLPSALVDTLDDDALGHVLAHEHAHVVRRDTLLVATIAVVCALLWPVLPLWIAAARVRGLVERAADQRALLGASMAERRAFGRTLLRLAGVSPPSQVALALGGYRDLRGRVHALRSAAELPRALQLLALGSAVALPLACAGHAEPASATTTRCAELQLAATRAHDRFEGGEAEQAVLALAAYDDFAQDCSDTPELTDLLYYRAELYWAIAHAIERRGEAAGPAFAEAHDAFLEALDAGTERFEVDAATAQMLAKRAELGISTAGQDDHGGPIHERVATDYTAAEQALLRSYDRFEEHVDDPANAQLQQVLLHRARLAMAHDRFDDARVATERLLAGSDGEEVHVRAAEILVDVHTIAATDPRATPEATALATDALVQLCQRIPTLALWRHAEASRLREAVPTLEAGMRWRIAERLASAGDPIACGEMFEALADEHPEHPRHDVMLRNGMSCYRDGDAHPRAATLARALLDAHPGSAHADDARTLLAGP